MPKAREYEWKTAFLKSGGDCSITFDSCNMGTRDLPDMYALSPALVICLICMPKARGLRAEGIHIRQITSAHVTTIM